MILLNEYEISEWAYYYCLNIKDDPEIRKYITNSKWAFYYCIFIENDLEIAKNIKYPYIRFI